MSSGDWFRVGAALMMNQGTACPPENFRKLQDVSEAKFPVETRSAEIASMRARRNARRVSDVIDRRVRQLAHDFLRLRRSFSGVGCKRSLHEKRRERRGFAWRVAMIEQHGGEASGHVRSQAFRAFDLARQRDLQFPKRELVATIEPHSFGEHVHSLVARPKRHAITDDARRAFHVVANAFIQQCLVIANVANRSTKLDEHGGGE